MTAPEWPRTISRPGPAQLTTARNAAEKVPDTQTGPRDRVPRQGYWTEFGPFGRTPGWPSLLLGLIAAVGVLVGLIGGLPLAANADDHIRYYFEGYLASAKLGLLPTLPNVTAELDALAQTLSPLMRQKLVIAVIPYSPFETFQTLLLESLRRALKPDVSLDWWMLVGMSTIWLILFAALLTLTLRQRLVSPAWVLLALFVTSFVHGGTHPLGSEPRNMAVFVMGLAYALFLRGGSLALVASLLAFAAFLHPHHAILNLAILSLATVVLGWRGRWRDAIVGLGVGVASSAVAYGFVLLTSPSSTPDVGTMLGGGLSTQLMQNLRLNQETLLGIAKYQVPLLSFLVWRQAGWQRGLIMAAVCLGSLGAAAGLTNPGLFPGVYVNRLGGAWSTVALGLLLRDDLLRALGGLAPARRRLAAALGAVALVLAVAVFARRENVATKAPRLAWVAQPRTAIVGPNASTESKILDLIQQR